MDTAVLRDVHRFWLGELKSPDDFPSDKTGIWYRRSEETDSYIRDHFGRFIPEAARIDWDVAALSREEGVALVVLFDQFPRNLFRESGEAFAYDAKARELARRLLSIGIDGYFWVERVAIAMPFMHSEDIAEQDYSAMLFARLALDAPASLKEFCRGVLDFACSHRAVIRKYGRFPHRNAVLGRPSTADEAVFLAEKGRGF